MFQASMIVLAALTVSEAPFSGTPTEKKEPASTTQATETVATDAAAPTEKKGPPYADKGPSTAGPKPPERTWTVKSGEFAFTVNMKPGIPDPDQVTEILISAYSIPKTPHPKFGNRVPVESGHLTLEIASPGGEVVAKFLAHEMPLAVGKYGLHFTPGQEGIYSLAIRGSTADGKAVAGDLKLPVKVWPLPAELQGSGDGSDKSGGRAPIRN